MKSLFAVLAMVLTLAIIVPNSSFAQTPAASVAPAVAPVASVVPAATPIITPPAFLVSIDNAVAKIPASIPAWILAVLAFLIELCMRFFPTVKPQSLLLIGSQVLGSIGVGLQKISALLDSVVQNVKSS